MIGFEFKKHWRRYLIVLLFILVEMCLISSGIYQLAKLLWKILNF